MGAKTAFAAALTGDPRSVLAAGEPDAVAAAVLLETWLPGGWVADEPTTLDIGVNPPRGGATALRLPGIDIVAADAVLDWIDGSLPGHVAESIGDRRLVIHQMHSVNDSLGFGVWQDGALVRALGMDPDNGIFLDEGERTAAELPFWAGEHAQDDYPLPFHPLDLGEELLRAELGFVLEGTPGPGDPDVFDITMFGFRPAPREPRGRRGLFRRR